VRFPACITWRRRASRPGLARLALLGSLAVGSASCANAGANEAQQPVLRSEIAYPAGPSTSETVAASEWVVDDVVGEPLPARSTAEQIKAAVEQAHGRTNDVAGEMARFVAFPAVPTPERAELVDLRADVRTTSNGVYYSVTSEVTFAADGTVDEILDLYQSSASELGWTPLDQNDQLVDGVLLHQLTFKIPDSAYERADFELQVRPEGQSTSRSEIWLRYVDLIEITDGSVYDRFVGWASGLPLPAGGEITGAGIQTSSVGRKSLHYSLAMTYDGQTPEDLAETLRGSLPTPSFEIEPRIKVGDDTDNWVYLASPFFLDARVSTHAIAEAIPVRTVVNVDGRVEFDPGGA
jgi:hypothetical protein